MDFKNVISKLGPRGWAMAGGSLAAFILFIVVVMSFASKPSYATMLTGLDPAQTGKITSALDAKGIPYEIQNNGTALAVQSDKVGEARIALATGGLLSASQPGMSLFDKQQLGASNFQQQITYQRALEGQLAQTIDSIQGVTSAQVQLVIPDSQQQLFSAQTSPATGAVMLSANGTLDPGSVRGIAQMVASSVPGLKADKVTITDNTGALLWPTSSAGGAGGGDLLAKQTAQNQYDSMMAAQAQAVLTQAIGPGKAEVQVNADLNANQATTDSLTYTGKPRAMTQATDNETLIGGSGATAGGATGNVPGYAQTTAGKTGSAGSRYKHTTTNATFGVNKTVTHAVIAPGQVNRQTVAVLVDKSVPASALPALRAAVANAVGLQARRGDSLSFGQVAFAKTTTPALPSSPNAKMIGYAKYLAAALGSLFFLAFIARLLRRREREAFTGTPTWLRELESPRPLAALEQEQHEANATKVMQLKTAVNPTRLQVEDLVAREPDRVAAQVRAWMVEE